MSKGPSSIAAYSLEAVVQSGGLVDREEPFADLGHERGASRAVPTRRTKGAPSIIGSPPARRNGQALPGAFGVIPGILHFATNVRRPAQQTLY